MSSFENLKNYIKNFCIFYGDFTLSSGEKSSVYYDLRRATLNSKILPLIGEVIYEKLRSFSIYGVAGEGVGATPLVIATAFHAFLRGQTLEPALIRKHAKGHGRGKRVEGVETWPAGVPVAVLEDTTTTGKSLIEACEAIKECGFTVRVALTLLNRGGDHVKDKLKSQGILFETVYNLKDVTKEKRKK